MDHPRFQMSVAALLGVVACVAVNIWLFRFGLLWGFLGLNVTRHVLTALLCQTLGIDRTLSRENPPVARPTTVAGPVHRSPERLVGNEP